MKVVYNSCYGGFSLSEEAKARFARAKGKEPKDIYVYDIERSDPDLVQIVEDMNRQAGNSLADLQIEDVPAGARWRIDEYDGMESVMLITDYDWHIAT